MSDYAEERVAARDAYEQTLADNEQARRAGEYDTPTPTTDLGRFEREWGRAERMLP